MRMWSRWRAAWGWTSRIGPKFLRPGIGYGGSCFPKDVAAFRSVAEQMGVDFSLLTEVEKINVAAEEALSEQGAVGAVDAARQEAGGAGAGVQGRDGRYPRVARRSIWWRCCWAKAAAIVAYDPAAMERAKAELPPSRADAVCGGLRMRRRRMRMRC